MEGEGQRVKEILEDAMEGQTDRDTGDSTEGATKSSEAAGGL